VTEWKGKITQFCKKHWGITGGLWMPQHSRLFVNRAYLRCFWVTTYMVKRFLHVNCFFERSNLRILTSMAEIIAKCDRWSCNDQSDIWWRWWKQALPFVWTQNITGSLLECYKCHKLANCDCILLICVAFEWQLTWWSTFCVRSGLFVVKIWEFCLLCLK
jgi:hypothetical protein